MAAVARGEGLDALASLAADVVGGPVAIVLDSLGATGVSPGFEDEPARFEEDPLGSDPSAVDGLPSGSLVVPILLEDEVVGRVALLAECAVPEPVVADRFELVAAAAVTYLVISEEKRRFEAQLRGSLLDGSARAAPPIRQTSSSAPAASGSTSRAGR